MLGQVGPGALQVSFSNWFRQGKANRAADALFRFLQKSLNEKEKLWAENTQNFHRLQFFFTKINISGLNLGSKPNLSLLHQVFICSTYVLPQLSQFWKTFQTELAAQPYKASISRIRLRLADLQESDAEAQKIKAEELKEGLNEYINVDRVLHHQELLFVPELWQPLGRPFWYQ